MERLEFIKKFAYGGSILLTAPVILSACSSSDDDFVPEEPNEPDTDLTIDLTSSTYEDLGTIGGYVYGRKYYDLPNRRQHLSGAFKSLYTRGLHGSLQSCQWQYSLSLSFITFYNKWYRIKRTGSHQP